MKVHFLHIGKTGGNAVREALAPLISEGAVIWHPHRTNLADIPAGERVVFFVREPTTRFVSAFNSRLRKGQPKRNARWSEDEAAAFQRFARPNALAEALASADPETRSLAEHAMQSIAHVNKRQSEFLAGPAYVERRRADIAFVGFQETLDADFERMKRVLGYAAGLVLPKDPVAAHRTPGGFDTSLSQAGRAAIETWYADDVALYRWLRESWAKAAQPA